MRRTQTHKSLIASLLLFAFGSQALLGPVPRAFAGDEKNELKKPTAAECADGLTAAAPQPAEVLGKAPVVAEIVKKVADAPKSPAVQSIFSLKKPWRLLGHIIPILPMIKTVKDKDRRFFVFVESPFVTGIPSTAASVILTKALFWGLGVAFLGSTKAFPELLNFDSLMKFAEVFILYQGVNIFRNGVTIDPTIPDNKLEWYKSEKFWLNYQYSAVGYGLGTQMIKPLLISFANWLHVLKPDVFPAPPAMSILDDAHKLGEKTNAAAWPIFSQYMATYIVTPIMFGRWPKKGLMDEIRQLNPETPVAKKAANFAEMVAERDNRLNKLEKDLAAQKELAEALKKLPKSAREDEAQWPTAAQELASQLRIEANKQFEAKQQAQKESRTQSGLKGSLSRAAQWVTPTPKVAQVGFSKVLSVAKFKAMNTRNAIQELQSEKRWILYLTQDLKVQKGQDIKKTRWAGMYTHKIAVGITIAMAMQSLYWGMRTVIAGDVSTNTPTIFQRFEQATEMQNLEKKILQVRESIEQNIQQLSDPNNMQDPMNEIGLSEQQLETLGREAAISAEKLVSQDPLLEPLSEALQKASQNPGQPIEVSTEVSDRLESIQTQMSPNLSDAE